MISREKAQTEPKKKKTKMKEMGKRTMLSRNYNRNKIYRRLEKNANKIAVLDIVA